MLLGAKLQYTQSMFALCTAINASSASVQAGRLPPKNGMPGSYQVYSVDPPDISQPRNKPDLSFWKSVSLGNIISQIFPHAELSSSYSETTGSLNSCKDSFLSNKGISGILNSRKHPTDPLSSEDANRVRKEAWPMELEDTFPERGLIDYHIPFLLYRGKQSGEKDLTLQTCKVYRKTISQLKKARAPLRTVGFILKRATKANPKAQTPEKSLLQLRRIKHLKKNKGIWRTSNLNYSTQEIPKGIQHS